MEARKEQSRVWEAFTPALSEWILDAISSMGFLKMTPVQASVMPLFMGNKDVVVEAVTGSGKTLAYLIPVIEKLLRAESNKKHHIVAIIISPTRELASQIHSVLLSLLRFHPPSAAGIQPQSDEETEQEDTSHSSAPNMNKIVAQLIVGGSQTPIQDVAQFLRTSPNILIGTPGRLLHLLNSPHVHCTQSSFENLVLDEADRLLDLGFKDDLQKILARLPKQRRTGLFSASVGEAVDQLIRVGLRNPVRITVKVRPATGQAERKTPVSLQMSYLITKPSEKLPSLAKLLHNLSPTPQKAIVYVSSCAAVDYFQHILPSILPSFTVVPLHGKHVPKVRQRNFDKFLHSVSPNVLLTTDVAARGLDIPLVDLVVQIDPPSDSKVFLHRCGRAGRAGRRGLAVTLISPGREEEYIDYLAVRKTPVTKFDNLDMVINESEATSMTRKIRDMVGQDRALHEKAQRAFVSWVQSYRKHQASSIFRIGDLDWLELADAWGLLRIPKMPEIKHWQGDRSLGLSINFEELKYKDKIREKRRSETKDGPPTAAPARRNERKEQSESWSGKKALKGEKDARREKRKSRKDQIRNVNMTEDERTKRRELEQMIAQVRARNLASDEFEGFDDGIQT